MSSDIVTGNVTSYLQSVFHPEWTFNSISGFMFQLNTSLMGNVDIGDLSTNYTLKLNGIEIAPSGQGVASLNTLTGALTISTHTISNISIGTAGSNIFIDFSGTAGGGGTAGVTSISGLTGAVGLSAGIGIDISTLVSTSEFVITNLGVTTISGDLSGNVEFTTSGLGIEITTSGNGLVFINTGVTTICGASGEIVLLGSGSTTVTQSPSGTFTINSTGGGAFTGGNIDLSGQDYYIWNSSGGNVTISGTSTVTDALAVGNGISVANGNIQVTNGNITMTSGNLTGENGVFNGVITASDLILNTYGSISNVSELHMISTSMGVGGTIFGVTNFQNGGGPWNFVYSNSVGPSIQTIATINPTTGGISNTNGSSNTIGGVKLVNGGVYTDTSVANIANGSSNDFFQLTYPGVYTFHARGGNVLGQLYSTAGMFSLFYSNANGIVKDGSITFIGNTYNLSAEIYQSIPGNAVSLRITNCGATTNVYATVAGQCLLP